MRGNPAPLLARKHRVLAIARRGAGYSSKPDFGFDTPRLEEDVLQVMKATGLGKVVLVGHSITGEEVATEPVPLPFQHPEDALWFTYLTDSRTVFG